MRIEGDDDMNPDWMELVIEAGPMKQKPADCGMRNADCGLAEIPQSSIRNRMSPPK
jgi:hypothetical protein